MNQILPILKHPNEFVYKFLTITLAGFLFSLTVNAQTLFIIGEKSYPSTDVMTLKPNAENGDDLDVFLAKEGEFGFVGVSRIIYSHSEKFTGKLIIVLENGSVLTCTESELSEKVDDRAKALYPLTLDQLNKLKQSNIHTVEYSMIHDAEEHFSASNTEFQTDVLISKLFDPTEEPGEKDQSTDALNNADQSTDTEAKPIPAGERMPTFPGGMEAMFSHLNGMIEYPKVAKSKKISGTVIVQFTISADGDVEDASIVRGVGGGCDEEALRVINNMPKWIPGMHEWRHVPVTFTLPIKFVL